MAGLIKPAQRQCWPGNEAVGKPNKEGAYTDQRFNLSQLGRATEESRGFKPDPGNLAVRDYRGASGTSPLVGLGTQFAIERARLETPYLKRVAPDFYPNGQVIHAMTNVVNWQQEELHGRCRERSALTE